MKNSQLKKVLGNKTKPQLQVLCESVGLKRVSRLSKPKLINKLIEEDYLHEAMFQQLGIISPKKWYRSSWIQGVIFLALSGLIGLGFFLKSASKQDIESLEHRIDKNEEYLGEIEYMKKYRQKFLERNMNYNYKVFGIKNGKLITKEELKDSRLSTDYNSFIKFHNSKNYVEVAIDFREFQFSQSNIVNSSLLVQNFPIQEDVFYDFKGLSADNCLKYVLLKEDEEQPIIAIGLGNCQN